jgi:GH24 family phage-related lysozyme (muramidase)
MQLEEKLMSHEGFKLKKYPDSKCVMTIYVGHKCLPGEVYAGTKEDALKYLRKDIAIAKKDLAIMFPDYKNFSQNRQGALIEVLFNMGRTTITHSFPHFVHAVNTKQWNTAGDELQYVDGRTKKALSKWYKDVKQSRAEDILERIREG